MNKNIQRGLLMVGALVGSASAMAADPTAADAAVTGAMTTAGTSVALYGTGLVTLALVGVGFMLGIKYVKKIPRVG